MSAELDDVVETLNRSRDVWAKVAALDGSEFYVKCCFNSERCQRIKVEQTGGGGFLMESMDGPAPGEMPVEVEKILDVCKTNPTLKRQAIAYNRSRFDLVFKCAGRALVKWTIKDS